MASIVRQLETAIMAALESALTPTAQAAPVALVTGFRESVASGTVKTSDGDGRPEVAVQVSPATADGYAMPIVEFDVSITVRLDWSDDPTIAAFDEVAAVVETLLHRWNLIENEEDMVSALSTENFRCDGLGLRGGADSVTISGGNGVSAIMTVFNFAVKGIYREAETPTETTTTTETTTEGE